MSNPGGDLLGKIQAVIGSLAHFAEARLELLRCEWAEERQHLGDLLFHGLAILFLLFSTLEFFALLIVAWLWDTPWRVPAVAAIMILSLGATLSLAVSFQRKRKQPPALFESTAAAFREDSRLLDELQ